MRRMPAKMIQPSIIACTFFTINGIPSAYKALSDYANQNKMIVLMSIYGGQSWGLHSGGQSRFWNKNSKLISNLNDTDSGLLIVENIDDIWTGKTMKYECRVGKGEFTRYRS